MGTLTVRDIVKKSSNKGSAQLGMIIGEKTLYDYASAFGYGKKTDIGLTGEIAGTLRKVSEWDGLTITRLPMGHAVAATPLQVHCAMGVIANQGIYMQPQLVRRVYGPDGKTKILYPPRGIRRVVSAKIASLMGEMLSEVVSNDGTARRAQLKGFKVAGKTGTSQKIINGAYSTRHTWHHSPDSSPPSGRGSCNGRRGLPQNEGRGIRRHSRRTRIQGNRRTGGEIPRDTDGRRVRKKGGLERLVNFMIGFSNLDSLICLCGARNRFGALAFAGDEGGRPPTRRKTSPGR